MIPSQHLDDQREEGGKGRERGEGNEEERGKVRGKVGGRVKEDMSTMEVVVIFL